MINVTAIIERGSDGIFSIWSEQSLGDFCFGGYGQSVVEAKNDFQQSVQEALQEARKADDAFLDPIYDHIRISFKYDIPSFFNYFDWINVSKFADYAGINESKMRQYKSGLSYPGEKTSKKIFSAIRLIREDFNSISL